MHERAIILITLGCLFFIGLFVEWLGRRTRLPRVTLLLLVGFLLGHSGFGFISHSIASWFPIVTNIALAMVGFLLGGKVTLKAMRVTGYFALIMSLSIVFFTVFIVFCGLILLGANLGLALMLSAISAATAPAPIVDVIHELKSKTVFSKTLLGGAVLIGVLIGMPMAYLTGRPTPTLH